MDQIYDAIIVGGGPAGLAAAVVLGRCRRNVLIFDTGRQRNRFSKGMHNYLTRDDILPGDFLKISRAEIKKYGVRLITAEIISAEKTIEGTFILRDKKQQLYYCRKLLVATGLRDKIPGLPGFEALYGQSIFHCPYCDAWEVKDKLIGIYAKKINGGPLSLALKTWSPHVTLYTDGRNYLSDTETKTLKKNGVNIITEKIKSLEGNAGRLKNIIFSSGEKRRCDAIFFSNGSEQRSGIIKDLGCTVTSKGIAITNRKMQTNVGGCYIAGDAARDMHFVVVAAGEGAKAGVHINKELEKEARSR